MAQTIAAATRQAVIGPSAGSSTSTAPATANDASALARPSHGATPQSGASATQAQQAPTSQPAQAATASTMAHKSNSSAASTGPEAGLVGAGKPKKAKRRKVAKACLFCKRSHMTCDDSRPCQRCIKREIGHLCCDDAPSAAPSSQSAPVKARPETATLPPSSIDHVHPRSQPTSTCVPQVPGPPSPVQANATAQPFHQPAACPATSVPPTSLQSQAHYLAQHGEPSANSDLSNLAFRNSSATRPPTQSAGADAFSPTANSFNPFATPSDLFGTDLGAAGNEFASLGLEDFLKSLDDTSFLNASAATSQVPSFATAQLSPVLSSAQNSLPLSSPVRPCPPFSASAPLFSVPPPSSVPPAPNSLNGDSSTDPTQPTNKTERFLLTAADQKDGTRDERLARVIHAKFEAGLLKPYNYVAGYTRLMRWMESNMSAIARQRVLHTLSEFRPTFRAIASSLTDLDLVFIEEAFERLLLDYDRVFSTMGIPACLWRRTGEIYKGNKEFAELVGVPIELLREGRLAVYELMAEESAVNYWEKYSNIAFDSGQKAVLTSCVLRNQAVAAQARKRRRLEKGGSGLLKRERDTDVPAEAMLNCTFSFTVRRDVFNIPSLIVGNFLPC